MIIELRIALKGMLFILEYVYLIFYILFINNFSRNKKIIPENEFN